MSRAEIQRHITTSQRNVEIIAIGVPDHEPRLPDGAFKKEADRAAFPVRKYRELTEQGENFRTDENTVANSG